jgi:hypothetical protein
VAYDLPEGGDYEPIIKYIKSQKKWAHITESLWGIVSESSASEIRDKLLELSPKDARLFVLKSGVVSAWKNVICSNAWLKDNL